MLNRWATHPEEVTSDMVAGSLEGMKEFWEDLKDKNKVSLFFE